MERWKWAAAFLLLSCLTGCSSKGSMQVSVLDGQTETRLSVEEGATVRQILKEADITVEKGDDVSPSMDTVLSETGNNDITIERRVHVDITEDGETFHGRFTGGKVEDAVDAADIQLGKRDLINHELGAYLVDGMDIEVVHRYLVTLTMGGKKKRYTTRAHTVGGFLKEQEIVPGQKDRIEPGIKQQLKDGMDIVIRVCSVKRITEYESIAYETEIRDSDSMYEGRSTEEQAGQEGKRKITYKVTYLDGKEKERRVIKKEVVREPVDRILVRGTAKKPEEPASDQGDPSQSRSAQDKTPERKIVSKEKVYDCDGSGHGYYVITWSDGKVEYEDF